MAVVYSTTKGLAAMVVALAHSRGLIDYDELVCTYWPEFAQNGKEKVTVRQLLAHQSGLFAFDEPVDVATVADLDDLADVMARQKPAWEPGSRQAYHAISLGFYESELIRRVDPQHRSLGRYFQDEIATPLGLDFYIRLPESIPNSRLAVIEPIGFFKLLFGFPLKLALATMSHRSNIYRALVVNPGSAIVHDKETIYSRNLEVPSGGGVGTARAIAKAYGEFASGGKELGLRKETLDELSAEPVPSTNGFYDECMLAEAKFSLGFGKPGETMPFANASAFGHPGAGGSMGFADPENGIGYGYITNRMSTELTGDARDLALREALYSCLAD
jgi:CubicO group peptidase (beta-lactamase class C family)